MPNPETLSQMFTTSNVPIKPKVKSWSPDVTKYSEMPTYIKTITTTTETLFG